MIKIHEKIIGFHFYILAMHIAFISVKSQILYCQNPPISNASACLNFL